MTEISCGTCGLKVDGKWRSCVYPCPIEGGPKFSPPTIKSRPPTMPAFVILCNNCSSTNCNIADVSPPYADDGWYVECLDCGNRSEDNEYESDMDIPDDKISF